MTAAPALVALGDSITREPGSWAEQLAAELGLELLNLAADGEGADGVASDQLPRVPPRVALAALYVGVNDARDVDWNAARFEAALRRVAAGLAERADRLLVLTVPADLGRPPAGADAVECSALLRRVASEYGATVVALDDFGAPDHVEADHVHPTAAGQREIARRAARALAG